MAIVDTTLWRTLSPLLDRALELDPEERAAFVESLSESTPEAAAALARLLAEHESAVGSGFLEGSPELESPRSLAGQTIGAYMLVELLGAGGMGAVWRARRSDGRFEGDVAVKLLHPSYLDREGEERFRREGTILSRLAHPGIARLYDAGISPSGQPYLVLELVEGMRLDRHADARGLGVRARLDLFLQVAEAVAHAHSSLVVHRDLKPSNILVDRDGRVKLLDFGIATLVDEVTGSPAARTVTAARALTPEYAAPEQLDGRPITTATDVYSLGVLLYELLAGRHPTIGENATPAAVMRAVTQTEPPPMSAAVDRLPSTVTDSVARFAARATTRERLSRQLAGDLDTIVAKALKKEPRERYPTVGAFAEDLRRFLNDQPVRARPDSPWYRLRKFAARHRIETAAAAVVAVALLAATAIALVQARASARERDRALADLQRAEITNDFSAFLLAEATPDAKPISRAELWARGEKMIDHRFAKDPALQAHLLLLVADRYEDTMDYGSSRRLIERAFALSRDQPDARLRAVATCRMARAAGIAGEAERSDALLAEAFAALEREGDSVKEEAYCRFAESDLTYHRGDFARSIRAGERALELERQRRGPPGRALELLNELGMAYAAAGRVADSERSYGELFAQFEAQGRDRTQPAFLCRTNWAISLQREGQFLRAVEEWERAVALARELDPVHGALPFELQGLGGVLSMVGRHEEAIALVGEALAKTRAEASEPDLHWALALAGRVEAEAGRIEAAEALLAEADRLAAKSPALAPWRLAASDRARALLALAERDSDQAAARAHAALEKLESAKRAPRELLPALLLVARAENERGAHEPGLAAASRALDMASGLRGDALWSRDVGAAQLEIARARAGNGELDAARKALAEALANLQPTAGESSQDYRRAMAVQARLPV